MKTRVWTDLGEMPLVSCIMPTYGRPKLVPESVKMFLDQDYPNKELVILNDCPAQEYVCDAPNVRVINESKRYESLGEKRNAAIDQTNGSLIAIWDDDDVYLPWRLSFSVEQIRLHKTPLYRPSEFWAYWGNEQLVTNSTAPGWISHPLTLMRKDLWEAVGGYCHITLGEDAELFREVANYLDSPLSAYELSIQDRFFILRGTSTYSHTSISGGQSPPDTTPGRIVVRPHEIHDEALRSAAKRLIDWKVSRNGSEVFSDQSVCNDDRGVDYLDELPYDCEFVGYGEIGLHGELGYENRKVQIFGQHQKHAISAHGTSLLKYYLSEEYETFHSRVAINDDVFTSETAADFLLIADNEVVGIAQNVVPGDATRSITADIRGTHELKLVVRAVRWDCCHSVWVNPQLSKPGSGLFNFETDCLKRLSVEPAVPVPEADVCIATVGSQGYEDWIDDLFGSICANSQCPNASFFIFCIDESEKMRSVASKYHATLIRCTAIGSLGPATKSILYSTARFVRAEKYICLDADMLVLGDLRPILSAIDSSPVGSIHVCREAFWARDLSHAFESIYYGTPPELSRLLNGHERSEGRYELIINDGVFAGSRAALCAIDELIRGSSYARKWIDENSGCFWRNQFVLNLALAQLRSGRELAPEYNVQLNCQDAEFEDSKGVLSATSMGRNAIVVHFNGSGRGKHSDWRGRYSRISSPLIPESGQRDRYADFVAALRIWVGHEGTGRLAWSFYGTSDGSSARVTDATSFHLYAALYSLIRTNGCSRILESGTARGVSAACMASAVVDRDSPSVVTFDPVEYPERAELWGQFPASIRNCIEARNIDAIAGMTESLGRGETYHAALLDSVHTCEHVLSEFELASQLVCPGGLIIIHDPLWRFGSVGEAIGAISDKGYRVVTLWSAEEGTREDDQLGLAVVENRRYS